MSGRVGQPPLYLSAGEKWATRRREVKGSPACVVSQANYTRYLDLSAALRSMRRAGLISRRNLQLKLQKKITTSKGLTTRQLGDILRHVTRQVLPECLRCGEQSRSRLLPRTGSRKRYDTRCSRRASESFLPRIPRELFSRSRIFRKNREARFVARMKSCK
jgi:hypothetical protein